MSTNDSTVSFEHSLFALHMTGTLKGMWELLTLALTRLLFCLNLIHALSLLLNYNAGTLFQQSNTLSDKECHQWQHVTGKEVCLDLLMNVIASKHLYWAMLPFTNTHTHTHTLNCGHIHGTSPGTPAACCGTDAAAPLCAPARSAQPLRSAGSSPRRRSQLWPPSWHSHSWTRSGLYSV